MATAKFKYHSEWADGLRSEGREQGREQGLAEGLVEGRLVVAREMLIETLLRRFLTIDPVQHALIETCDDLGQLKTWHYAAIDASTVDEIFG